MIQIVVECLISAFFYWLLFSHSFAIWQFADWNIFHFYLFFFKMQAEDMQQQIIRETFHLVSKRDDNVCNFLEGGRQVLP